MTTETEKQTLHLAQNMSAHPDFKEKFAENTDSQNREIAFKKIFADVMTKQRKTEPDLYHLVALNNAFKAAKQHTLKKILAA